MACPTASFPWRVQQRPFHGVFNSVLIAGCSSRPSLSFPSPVPGVLLLHHVKPHGHQGNGRDQGVCGGIRTPPSLPPPTPFLLPHAPLLYQPPAEPSLTRRHRRRIAPKPLSFGGAARGASLHTRCFYAHAVHLLCTRGAPSKSKVKQGSAVPDVAVVFLADCKGQCPSFVVLSIGEQSTSAVTA